MGAFLAVFLLVMFSFSMAFHIGFGLHLYHYRGLGTTFITLIRFALGDVDIRALMRVNSLLGTILMVLFTFLLYLQLIGIAVAVIIRFYQMQPSDKEASFAWLRNTIEQRDQIIDQARSDMRNFHRAVLMAAKRERQARKRAKTAIESCAKSPASSFTSGGGSFTSGKKRVGALDGPSFGVVASRAVAGGSAGAGWISDIPPPSDVPDPMREAELAFGIKADDHAQRAIADAAKSTGT